MLDILQSLTNEAFAAENICGRGETTTAMTKRRRKARGEKKRARGESAEGTRETTWEGK